MGSGSTSTDSMATERCKGVKNTEQACTSGETTEMGIGTTSDVLIGARRAPELSWSCLLQDPAVLSSQFQRYAAVQPRRLLSTKHIDLIASVKNSSAAAGIDRSSCTVVLCAAFHGMDGPWKEQRWLYYLERAVECLIDLMACRYYLSTDQVMCNQPQTVITVTVTRCNGSTKMWRCFVRFTTPLTCLWCSVDSLSLAAAAGLHASSDWSEWVGNTALTQHTSTATVHQTSPRYGCARS
jgi:hypothetical protein